ncbi:MAG TPA: type II toxin-antitoxin system PemK/MazF family toxin [Cyclobacteriaceae bacterium]|nr:type II toxin-antitoxin system PemK/MazF family toxin [Cyclobacteriaceae bacterium]
MNRKPLRGEIWVVHLDPAMGHEQAKRRPCVIISHDTFNQGPSGLVVVLPLTSKLKKISWHITINPPEGDISITSQIMCDQIRTVSLKRLGLKPLGVLSRETMQAIEARLKILLDFSL